MKPLRRAFNFLLAVALMLALTIPVFAVDYSIGVQNDASKTGVSIDGNIYSAYKLFNVVYDTTKTAFSYTVDSSCLSVTYNSLSGSNLINWLSTASDADVRSFADYVYTNYIAGKSVVPGGSATASGESAVIPLTSAGYYLVYGTGGSGDTTVTASVSLTTAKPTATIQPKLSVPSLDKQIQHNESGSWGNVGDNQIGDTVHYRTITSVPDTNNYTTYTYVIHDTMSDGLTFDSSSLVIKINDEGSKELTRNTDYTITSDAHSFTVSFSDVKSLIAAQKLTTADHFYVYYNATLNKSAKLYTDGSNDNMAYLEYSNNPYDDGHGETPPVKVYDWTFTMGVNKTDKDSHPLTGAEFILNTDSNSTSKPIALIKNGNSYTIAPDGTSGTVTTISAGSIVIKGLDDSTIYYLHETKAPDGYNLLPDPVKIQISASYDANGALLSNSPTVAVGGGAASSTLSTNVVNLTGNELPSTGGMGTTIFYGVGSTLAIGAGLILIARKRLKNEN
ncbi:SpaH/EbpB family LPXTG-anchored major pilin [Oscillibacter sp.]|uniref:SpaH/EbpB family LPXTG-anchored major pilin n=1 Tax=Oscillibacter sp. TaxID=1945593 RepID=UPI0028AF0637|nr:SpaH/EbpB family LPXTG-anchored major pilin [Oscillibacter sp.]